MFLCECLSKCGKKYAQKYYQNHETMEFNNKLIICFRFLVRSLKWRGKVEKKCETVCKT